MHSPLLHPWPWYVAGPLIGLFAPLLLWLGNRLVGVSSNLRHMCAAIAPRGLPYLSYDWRREGGWNLAFVAGIVVGGALAGWRFRNPAPVAVAESTRAALASLGIHDRTGLVPREVFAWSALATLLRETDAARVDFEMDVYWVVKGGGDPLALLAAHPGRFVRPGVHASRSSRVPVSSKAARQRGRRAMPSARRA